MYKKNLEYKYGLHIWKGIENANIKNCHNISYIGIKFIFIIFMAVKYQ